MGLSELDDLGRCRTAMMCAHSSLLPKEKRGSMKTKPSGWHQNKYEFLKSDDNPAGYFMCRAHLLPFCLTGILDDERNLISSTFSMNGYTGMETYEMEILSYIKRNPDNHVIYSLQPVFVGEELFPRGVHMQAESVEDDSICFNVFVYNAENGIYIDYATGNNYAD